MSELVDNLKKIVTTFKDDSVLIQKAAQRIEELESTPRISAELQANIDSLRAEIREEQREPMRLRDEIARLRVDIYNEQQKNKPLQEQLAQAEKVIAEMSAAAGGDPAFSDIVIARISAQAQQSEAMTRICENHIATCRKAEAANLKLNGELSKRMNECDDLRSQLQHRSALLHDIADLFGAGSRNAVPAKDWYVDKISAMQYENRGLVGQLANLKQSNEAKSVTLHQLAHALEIDPMSEGWHTLMLNKAEHLQQQPLRLYVEDLKKSREVLESIKKRISAANARWEIKVADPDNYVQQLDYLLDDEMEYCRNKGSAAQRELDLAVGAIKRMHHILLLNRDQTGIWPNDDRMRAKLDDIEWCLNVYVGRHLEAKGLREADTKFLGNLRDSLQNEISRRKHA